MASSLSLGRYVPSSTSLHRLDPRVKIIALIVFFVAVFLDYGSTQQNFVMYGIFFLLFLIIMIIGKVSFLSVLNSLKGLWLMMLLLLIINSLLTNEGDVAFSIGTKAIYWSGIIKTGYIIVRLMLMIMITTILTTTTKPMELTFGLEWLLTPLKYIKVPIHIIAMTLSLALRFIPTLAEEANKIMRAQASRGVDFKEGKIKEKFKAITSLVIPLFVSSFMRAGDLADAMEARGYDPLSERTKYRKRNWNLQDTLMVILLNVFLAGLIYLAVVKPDFIELIKAAFNG
jgi:energy-coupling factor transport system permease protein